MSGLKVINCKFCGLDKPKAQVVTLGGKHGPEDPTICSVCIKAIDAGTYVPPGLGDSA